MARKPTIEAHSASWETLKQRLHLDKSQIQRLTDWNSSFMKDRDAVDRNFDDEVLKVLKAYCRIPKELDREVEYLNNLKSDDGRPYSQSSKRIKDLIPVIQNFLATYQSDIWRTEYYQHALATLQSELNSQSLHSLTYESDSDIVGAIPKENTSSGFERVLTGLKYKGMFMDGIFKYFQSKLRTAIEKGSFQLPILPGTRLQGQEVYDEETGERTHKCKLKTRLINMVSLSIIIAELKFAKQIQKSLSANFKWYAGGKNPDEITRLMSDYRARFRYFISLDYSGYDQTVPAEMLRDVFKLLRSMFRNDAAFDEVTWELVVHEFIEKDLIWDGKLVHLNKGVPSGSMFTQIVDTICNRLIILTYLYSIGVADRDFAMLIMGDDNIIFLNSPIHVDGLKNFISEKFGMSINGTKSDDLKSTEQTPHFLSRYWRFEGQWRHWHVIVSKLLYPERRRKDKYYQKDNYFDPDLVIFGWIYAVPLGMNDLIDVGKFLSAHPKYKAEDLLKVVDYLPGQLAYEIQYGSHNDAYVNRLRRDMV